ncbi:MAG: hypothetical protein RR588_03350 [Solibacillus sp.]
MLFPIIRIVDNDSTKKVPRIVGINSHDMLCIDKETGGIQYHNLQCCDGTTKYLGKSSFSFVGIDDYDEYSLSLQVEMVSFEKLCEIYLEQTRQNCEFERKLRDMIRSVTESRDALIKEYKLDEDDGIRNTGGNMI